MVRGFLLLLALVAGGAAPAIASPNGLPGHFLGDKAVHARLILENGTFAAGGSTEVTVALTPIPWLAHLWTRARGCGRTAGHRLEPAARYPSRGHRFSALAAHGHAWSDHV